jgi:hypothetical protein
MGTVLSHLHVLDMLLKLYSVTTWTDEKQSKFSSAYRDGNRNTVRNIYEADIYMAMNMNNLFRNIYSQQIIQIL